MCEECGRITGSSDNMQIHGGDIYRQDVELDFSVNGNPCGMPEGVKDALHRAVEQCAQYPDTDAQELRGKLAERLQVSREQILVGNGASELFPAIVRAVAPRKTVIPVPSFGGYEYAVSAWTESCLSDRIIVYYPLREENEFALTQEILSVLDEQTDLLFLAQPNNPVGNLIEESLLELVLTKCLEKRIRVVLDECFLALCSDGKDRSFVHRLRAYPNVLVVRAFTKTFAMPGARLGYVVCSDTELLGNVRRQLAEWNVSILAQAAGIAALEEKTYLQESVRQIASWREQLAAGLEMLGFRVYSGEANFVFFRWEQEQEQVREQKPEQKPEWKPEQNQAHGHLYQALLERKILIRDCWNYRGLGAGYYRVAVRKKEENDRLVQVLKSIV